MTVPGSDEKNRFGICPTFVQDLSKIAGNRINEAKQKNAGNPLKSGILNIL